MQSSDDSFVSAASDFLTSPGNTSTSSIPWAEDCINKNRIEWERVERQFYGEEPLPTNDPDLRAEILEWNRLFPHLRVCGQRIEGLPKRPTSNRPLEAEELLALHPAPYSKSAKTLVAKKSPSLESDLSQYLHISAGPIHRSKRETSTSKRVTFLPPLVSPQQPPYIEKIKTIEVVPASIWYKKLEPITIRSAGASKEPLETFYLKRTAPGLHSKSAFVRTAKRTVVNLPPIVHTAQGSTK